MGIPRSRVLRRGGFGSGRVLLIAGAFGIGAAILAENTAAQIDALNVKVVARRGAERWTFLGTNFGHE